MDTMSPHILVLLIISVLLIGVSVVLAYLSRREAVVAALAALLVGKWSGYVSLGPGEIWFWVIAAAIVLGLLFLLPSQISTSRVGLGYFATGAITGAFLGMLLNSVAGVICGAAIGVLLGAVAYSRVPAGRDLGFPSRKSFNYILAKGLPLVVIFSMLGILCLQLIIGTTV